MSNFHAYRIVIKTASGDEFSCRKYLNCYGPDSNYEEFKKKIFNEFKTEGFIDFKSSVYKSDKVNSYDVCINTKHIESIRLIYENTY